MQFSKRLVFAMMGGALAVAMTVPAHAQNYNEMAEEIKQLTKERTKKMLDSGMLDDMVPPERRENPYQENVRVISSQSMLDMSDSMARYGLASKEDAQAFSNSGQYSADDSDAMQEPMQMYLSFGMGESNLKAAIQSAARQGATVFFNGLQPGQKTIDAMLSSVHALVADMDDIPNIRFNPYGFEYHGITQTPTITYTDSGYTSMVSGITGFRWLVDRHESEGATKDYGVQGPTAEVIERNLLDEIEERYKALDMKKQKQQAIARFWEKKEFNNLPAAKESETWYIDPTVRVGKDITNSQGDILARAGTVVNPLKSAPMAATYLAFDATSKEQIAFVKQKLNELSKNQKIMLITSQVDRRNGWEHLQSLRDDFGQEIYLLQPEMVKKFSLKALPTVISTDLQKYVLKIQQFELTGEPTQ